MRKSELLDSLDLEMKPIQKKKPIKPQQENIEEVIGYENADSEQEDELWNYTLKNVKRDIKQITKSISKEM